MAGRMVKYDPYKSNGVKKSKWVDPLTSREDIEKVKQFLLQKKNKRDYLLFMIGITFGLRITDILNLQWDELLNPDLTIVDVYRTIEQKRRRIRDIYLGDSIKQAITLYLQSVDYKIKYNDYVFKSQKTGRPPNVASACMMLKNIFKDAGMNPDNNYCSHTLRKTTGTMMHKNGGDLWEVSKVYGHQSQQETMCYMGITKQRIKELYLGLDL